MFRGLHGVVLAPLVVPVHSVVCTCLCCDMTDDPFGRVLLDVLVVLLFIYGLLACCFGFSCTCKALVGGVVFLSYTNSTAFTDGVFISHWTLFRHSVPTPNTRCGPYVLGTSFEYHATARNSAEEVVKSGVSTNT